MGYPWLCPKLLCTLKDLRLELSASQIHILKVGGWGYRVTGPPAESTFLRRPLSAASRPRSPQEITRESGVRCRWPPRLPLQGSLPTEGGRGHYGSPALEHSSAPLRPKRRLREHAELGQLQHRQTVRSSPLALPPAPPQPPPSARLTGTSALAAPALLACHPQWPAFYRHRSQ